MVLRQFSAKHLRITSINRNFSYSCRSTSLNLTTNSQREFHNRTTNGIISHGDNFHRSFYAPAISSTCRNYSSQKPTDDSRKATPFREDDDPSDDDDDLKNDMFRNDDDIEYDSSDDETMDYLMKKTGNNQRVPAVTTVPEHFPRLPLLTTSFPIFPKFVNIFEIIEPNLIKLIEWKLKLNQPYVGIFVRKEQRDSDILYKTKDVNECYPVGAFVKITEVQRLEGKIKFVATAHRRIVLEKQLKSDRVLTKKSDKMARKQMEEIQSMLRESDSNVLMVEVKNMEEQQPDLKSPEYKAITMEIVKTIRDIITSNTLIRENLQQLMGNNLRVNDNPSYLADLAASITSSRADEMQEIMGEKDVLNRMKMALNLLIKEKQLLELQKKIGQEVEEKIRDQHKTYMLREQLKTIRRELGLEKDDKDALAEKYQKLMEGKVVPEAVQKILDEEIQKLGFLDNNGSEFT